MNDIGIGAVGTAIIAGLISLLGLIIGKEQKVSEFRQAWIDELRKCLISYLANINAIADSIRVAQSEERKPTGLEVNYKALNEANHGIKLRVNETEEPSIALLSAMGEFEALATSNSKLTPENIRAAEEKFLSASKDLLKFEWKRVKRGEKTYFWTRNIVLGVIALMLLIFFALWSNRNTYQATMQVSKNSGVAVTNYSESNANALPKTQSSCSEGKALESQMANQKPLSSDKPAATPISSTAAGRGLRDSGASTPNHPPTATTPPPAPAAWQSSPAAPVLDLSACGGHAPN